LVEKPKVGQCEEVSQRTVVEEVLGNDGEHISTSNSGFLHKFEV